MTLKHLGRGDHWLEPRAHCTGIPLLEEAQSCPCVGTLPKMAKLLFERPGSTDSKSLSSRSRSRARRSLSRFSGAKRKGSAALQGLFSFPLKLAMLGAAHLHRPLRCDAWQHGSGHEQFLPEASWLRMPLESRAHVHDDGFDVLTLLERYALKEPFGTGSFAAFGDFQHPRAFRIAQN